MIKRWQRILVVTVFGWVLISGLIFAWRESPTTDEGIHVASGYLALTRHETYFDPEHPFLFKYFSAAPLLILQPNLPQGDQALWQGATPTLYDSWREAREWTDRWLYTSGNNAQLLIFLARVPAVLCFLFLCWLVYSLSSRWFSSSVGIWALLFTAFNPTLFAHSHLANTDGPIALAFFLTIWALYRYWEHPSWRTSLWAGLALVTALLTKFSAIALLPIAAAWLIYVAFNKKVSWKQTLLYACGNILLIFVGIWTVYQWHSPLNLALSDKINPVVLAHYTNLSPLTLHLYKLLPVGFLKGIILTLISTEGGRRTYLLNHLFGNGVWFYFPIVFLLKTQIVGLVLVLYGAITSWPLLRKVREWNPLAILLTGSSLFFLALALVNKLDIGIRHITPLMPFLAILMALALERMVNHFASRTLITCLLLAFYILPVLAQLGNPIGFSNIFVHPSTDAYTYFDDSNLDWGQQSQNIAKAVQEHFAGQEIFVNYKWSPYALGYYGLKSRAFDPLILPSQGIIILTASQISQDPVYAKFRPIKPVLVIQNSVFFYQATDLLVTHSQPERSLLQ